MACMYYMNTCFNPFLKAIASVNTCQKVSRLDNQIKCQFPHITYLHIHIHMYNIYTYKGMNADMHVPCYQLTHKFIACDVPCYLHLQVI